MLHSPHDWICTEPRNILFKHSRCTNPDLAWSSDNNRRARERRTTEARNYSRWNWETSTWPIDGGGGVQKQNRCQWSLPYSSTDSEFFEFPKERKQRYLSSSVAAGAFAATPTIQRQLLFRFDISRIFSNRIHPRWRTPMTKIGHCNTI